MQAMVSSKADGSEDVQVSVQLPDGRVVQVSDKPKSGGRGGSGATIDVDWKEVR